MALSSQKLSLDIPCPTFTLQSVDGKTYSLSDFDKSRALLVAFICSHCPYVRAIEDNLIALRRNFAPNQLQVIGICSNDSAQYPDDAPEALLRRSQEKHYDFPYLVDKTQEIAKAFDAVCTPDLFLYNSERKLYYHGKFENLERAVQDLFAGKAPPESQEPSIGCSIKWYI